MTKKDCLLFLRQRQNIKMEFVRAHAKESALTTFSARTKRKKTSAKNPGAMKDEYDSDAAPPIARKRGRVNELPALQTDDLEEILPRKRLLRKLPTRDWPSYNPCE